MLLFLFTFLSQISSTFHLSVQWFSSDFLFLLSFTHSSAQVTDTAATFPLLTVLFHLPKSVFSSVLFPRVFPSNGSAICYFPCSLLSSSHPEPSLQDDGALWGKYSSDSRWSMALVTELLVRGGKTVDGGKKTERWKSHHKLNLRKQQIEEDRRWISWPKVLITVRMGANLLLFWLSASLPCSVLGRV